MGCSDSCYSALSAGCSHSIIAVIFRDWFSPHGVSDFFLGTRREGLIDFEIWNEAPFEMAADPVTVRPPSTLLAHF